jgi:hypothetical protein
MTAEIRQKIPDLLGVRGPARGAGMRATATIDFGVVVSGRVILELEDGQAELGPGVVWYSAAPGAVPGKSRACWPSRCSALGLDRRPSNPFGRSAQSRQGVAGRWPPQFHQSRAACTLGLGSPEWLVGTGPPVAVRQVARSIRASG